MRRLAVLIAVLACPPVAGAADLVVAPRQFSPAEEWLSVQAQLPRPARVGVQLATLGGRPIGWIAAPQRRRYLSMRWKGQLEGARVPDGRYRIKLLSGKRELAWSPLKIDRTAPKITRFEARNDSRTPFTGDNALLTTISPNNDGLRDSAKIQFTLSEPARVQFEVTRTISAPETIYELKATLPRGLNTFTWFPPKSTGARTYLVRINAVDGAGNRGTYGAATARAGRRASAPVVRVLGVDAGFTRESYAGGEQARLAVETDATSLTLQVFRAGEEDVTTHSDTTMNGVAVTEPTTVRWTARNRRATLSIGVGPWASGLYFVKLVADDGRIGYAPFVVRPATLGATSRVAVVLPTNTWQAYNFRDADGNGWGDTWYAKGAQSTAELGRAFLRRGVPPQYRKYDANFLRWLHWTNKQPELLTESDLESIRTAEELLALYDFVIFPGHTEYVTRHEYDLIRNYRDLGGNLAFLSANNFFWEVKLEGRVLRRTRLWREAGLPESALIGVQYRANDDGRIQRPFAVTGAQTAPWFYAGTGLADGGVFGETLGGYGIEIDATTPASPIGTIVLAEIPNLYGPGLTAQMTYYETEAGAKVFAGGALDFGGSATLWPVRRMLENLWGRLAAP